MKTLAVLLALSCSGLVRGEGRAGTIQFSDGHVLSGGIALSPGKSLLVYTTDTTPVTLDLSQVKEIRFKVEKEEMRH